MGIFDKIKDEAEKLLQKDPDAAKQAQQAGQDAMHNPSNLGQDMKAAQNTIKQQGGGPQDPNMDPNMEQGQGQD